ncbi:5-hydroxytryptamine receptor 6-like [Acanthaster planci]|uniref:5-hydroxytryptamine receptor 6-like n=1 Tax=Acanthaster planci TaxID=133434 RepID=A0A8B7ZUA6_ACAPL|nr:5-hydroxytryptamine receptor 6-like [Acanthaster planci]
MAPANDTVPLVLSATLMAYSDGPGTPADSPYSPLLTGLRTGFIVLTALVIVGGNAFSLTVIRVVDSPRFPPSSKVFLSYVILSDLVYGVFSMIFIAPAALNHWPYGQFLCEASHVVENWICACCVNAAVLVTIDRLLTVLYPLRHATMIPGKWALIIVTAASVIALVLAVSLLTGDVEVAYNNAAVMCLIKWSIGTTPYLIRLVVLGAYTAFIPAGILIGGYAKLYLIARQHACRRAQLQRGAVRASSSRRKILDGPAKGLRALKMCSLIASTFCVAWTPYIAVSFRNYAVKSEAPPLVDFLVNWLCICNSWWDVIIYFLMAKEFRRTALKVVQNCWLKNKPNYSNGLRVSSVAES